MLFALGLGDRVVGVTTYCHYPPEALKKPKIGTYLQPNFEAILAARPDLVVVVQNPVRLAERISRHGLPVVELGKETVAGVAESIERLGRAAGVEDRARRLNEKIRTDLQDIERRTANLPRRSLMFVVSRSPGRLEALMAAGRESYLNELIRIAGGRNAFEDAQGSYPKISIESVLARNPDVIVDMGEMADTTGVTDEQKSAVVRLWQSQRTLAAVRRGHVYAVASDIFVVPGPRMVDAARAFAKFLHPEAGF